MATLVRPAAVAGMFYPGNPEELDTMVRQLLAQAGRKKKACPCPKSLIVPHAGYIYSGPVAASAYIRLADCPQPPKRVVLVGPAHRVMVRGLALPEAGAFATPLGEVPLDVEAMREIETLPQVTVNSVVHAMEHSLEVHLPFLQRSLPDFRLIPLVAGDASPEEVAEVLNMLWGGEDTLILISSDLSHYLPYEEAMRVDMLTAQAIVDRKWPIHHRQACGATAINGLLVATSDHAMRAHLLDLRNSGDTAGGREQVVGYGAFAFCEEAA